MKRHEVRLRKPPHGTFRVCTSQKRPVDTSNNLSCACHANASIEVKERAQTAAGTF